MPSITRYDGSRFVTEEDVDREFIGKWVLIRVTDEQSSLNREGYLVASAEDKPEFRSALTDIAVLEYDSQATVIYGCKSRGDSLHVELHG